MESSHFLPSFLHVALYKTLFFDFWFRPHNAQNLLPKICTKSPISQLVWQIDLRCLRLPGGFWGWLIQWNHAKCCGADPCCHGNKIWARRGDPVTYRNYLLTYLLTYVCHYNVAGALEKYVQALEKKHKFDLLKNLYASVNGRSIDDAQMVEFFKMKFWMWFIILLNFSVVLTVE